MSQPRQPGENRRGVRILANRAGLSYRDTKQLLFEIMLDTPRASSAARTLSIAIGGEQHKVPREHQSRFGGCE